MALENLVLEFGMGKEAITTSSYNLREDFLLATNGAGSQLSIAIHLG